jgi:hypothetical protein
MNIHCKYDSLIETGLLKPHPKNRNKHPEEQVKRLAKILQYQGVRAPIVVSRLSGFIVKGHGTLKAIKANGWKEAPVVIQDFEDEDQEYTFVQSDNAIASWAELDLSTINADLAELGPFDIDLLGIAHFTVDPTESMRESGQVQNGPTAEQKLEKYLNRDFFEIKLEYDNTEYDQVIKGFTNYMKETGCPTISEVVLTLLQQWKP